MSFEWLYLYALPFMVVLTLVVFFHELGHYLLARRNGVKVEVFSIGFGPELFGFTDKAETRWKFSLIPLGGYVKMFSDLNIASQPDAAKAAKLTKAEKEISLFHKTVWQRIQVSAAGPIANFLFAIIVLALLYSISGQRVPPEAAKVGFVDPAGVAAAAGIVSDDIITHVNDSEITTFVEMAEIVRAHPGESLQLTLRRGTETLQIEATPEVTEGYDDEGNEIEVGRLGVAVGLEVVQRGFFASWLYAVEDTYLVVVRTLQSVGQMLTGAKSAEGLSGPLGIAKFTGDFATGDLASFFWFTAFLSINLGLINLFPIPVLDGGHLLFYFIEAIRGRPLKEKTQEYGYLVGFMVIIALMLYSTWNDLVRLEVVQYIRDLVGL